MRNLKADLETCNQATPGPWCVARGGFGARTKDHVSSVYFPGESLCYIARCGDCFTQYDAEVSKHDPHADAEFIAAAREGWPEAIQRAIEAEENIAKYKNTELLGFVELQDKNAALREELARKHNLLNDYKLAKDKLEEENDLQRASIQQLSGQVALLAERLQRIATPMRYLKEEAEKNGAELNGLAAAFCKDPNWLKDIARQALADLEGVGRC